MKHCFSLVLLTWCVLIGTALGQSALRHVDVYTSGTDGYRGYRIPAIETAPDGTLLAFAEARKYNLSDPGGKGQEIDLVLKRSTDGGATWSPMEVIEHSGDYWSSSNPATVVDRRHGRVWVFYLRCKPGRSTNAARPGTDDVANLARYSDDNGMTWSDSIDQTSVARDMADKQWRISVPGPGGSIQTRSGRLLVPMWKFAPWRDFAIYSDDYGKTWRRGATVPGKQGGDEDQLMELANGDILLDMRQQSGPHRWMATSSDGGQNWSEPHPGMALTRVCCAIERLTLESAGDDHNRIIWTGPKGPGRANLVARISYDEGRTFSNERPIANQPAAYSDLAILKDKSVGVLWERGNYRFITFTRLTLSYLEPK